MGRSTGPVLVAGTITWANQNLLDQPSDDLFTSTVRVGVATGALAGAMFGLEKIFPDFAVALSWAAVVTVLFVPFNNKPTPTERFLDLMGESGISGKVLKR